MKLSLAKDLDPLKAEACRRIDAEAELRARAASACPTIHAAKMEIVTAYRRSGGCNGFALYPEAHARGIEVAELAQQIAARHESAARSIAEIDARRLAAKARVSAAVSEAEIRAILAAVGVA